MSNDGTKPILQVFINPLVSWIWIGALTLVFGTLVALVPSKVKRVHRQDAHRRHGEETPCGPYTRAKPRPSCCWR